MRIQAGAACAGIVLTLFFRNAQAAEAAPVPMIALVQEESVPNQDGKIRTGLRLAFVKTANGWAAICDASKEKNAGCRFDANTASQWIVSERGKPAGHVTAKGWLDMNYPSETGLLKIVSGMPPRTGRRNHDFAGWNDNPVYPPLVATSVAPGASNRWSNVYPEKMAVAAILPVLKKQVPVIPDCTNGGQDDSKPGRPVTANDVHVFETWETKNGEMLVGAGIKPELVQKCDFTADALADVWLYEDDGEIPAQALPALIADETTHKLIAIGDFAGDGNEEALFWLAGYNEDGFVLYYDHFRKSAKFVWGYQ